jgi:hypothetical protein
VPTYYFGRDTEQKAAECLGLTENQAKKLFFFVSWNYSHGWPTEFEAAYRKAKTQKSKVEVACRRIDHFIATGE